MLGGEGRGGQKTLGGGVRAAVLTPMTNERIKISTVLSLLLIFKSF